MLDVDPPFYVPMRLAEKLKDLEIDQADRLVELRALTFNFDAASRAAALAVTGVVDEANRAAAGSPCAVEWLSFFACVDAASYKQLFDAVGAAGKAATKCVDGVFTPLVESARRHRLKNERDEMLLESLDGVAAGKRDPIEASRVAAILDEYDDAREAPRRHRRRQSESDDDDGDRSSGSGSGIGVAEEMETSASPLAPPHLPAAPVPPLPAAPSPPPVPVAPHDVDTAAAAVAASAALDAVVESRAKYAVLPSGPTFFNSDDSEDDDDEEGEGETTSEQDNGNGNRSRIRLTGNAPAASVIEPDENAFAHFFAYWLPCPSRTPQQLDEFLRGPPSPITAPASPAGQSPAEAERIAVRIARMGGRIPVDLGELRSDAGEFVLLVLFVLLSFFVVLLLLRLPFACCAHGMCYRSACVFLAGLGACRFGAGSNLSAPENKEREKREKKMLTLKKNPQKTRHREPLPPRPRAAGRARTGSGAGRDAADAAAAGSPAAAPAAAAARSAAAAARHPLVPAATLPSDPPAPPVADPRRSHLRGQGSGGRRTGADDIGRGLGGGDKSGTPCLRRGWEAPKPPLKICTHART